MGGIRPTFPKALMLAHKYGYSLYDIFVNDISDLEDLRNNGLFLPFLLEIQQFLFQQSRVIHHSIDDAVDIYSVIK